MTALQSLINTLKEIEQKGVLPFVEKITMIETAAAEIRKLADVPDPKANVNAFMGIPFHVSSFLPDGVIALMQTKGSTPEQGGFIMVVTPEWKERQNAKKQKANPQPFTTCT